jgi:hypothetical protein
MKKTIMSLGIAVGLALALWLTGSLQSTSKLRTTKVETEQPLSKTVDNRPDFNSEMAAFSGTTTNTVGSGSNVQLTLLDERQIMQENGSIRREILVEKSGKYPMRVIQETLHKDRQLRKYISAGRIEMVADHILVNLHEGISSETIEDLAAQFDATILRPLADGRTYIIQLKAPSLEPVAEAIEFFGKAAGEIAYAEPDYIRHFSKIPNDIQYDDLWGMRQISAPAAWNITTGSNGLIVAVIDTGMDMDHPDLLGNLWSNTDEIPNDGLDNDGNGYVDDVNGWDFGDDDKDPEDGNGHGTHCAGTIGAVGDNVN